MTNKIYARVVNKLVTEVRDDIPRGVTPLDLFHPAIAAQWVECPPEVSGGWAYDGKRWEEPTAFTIDLVAVKTAATAQIASMLDAEATALTGSSPIAERLSWSVKQDAARAYQAGNASADQVKMLEAEAALTGETIEILAATILTAASTYWAAAGAISGLRRSLSAAITAAETAEQVQDVLNGAKAQIELVLKGEK